MAKTSPYPSLEIGTLNPFTPDSTFDPEQDRLVINLDNNESIVARFDQREALSKISELAIASYWLDNDFVPESVNAEFGEALRRRLGFNGLSIAQRYPGYDPLNGRVRLRLESSKFWGSFITEGKATDIIVTHAPTITSLSGVACHEEGMTPRAYARF